MCGRYTLTAPADELVEVFDVGVLTFDRWPPRYNLAPTQDAPVIVGGHEGERRMGLMRWGLVPAWADDPSIGGRMINARSETAGRKPAFRDAFAERRCLVPADGFYEWQKRAGPAGGKPVKVPWWIHRPDRRPFAFAGLWERWRGGGGGPPLVTFTILTTGPNERVRALHDRMPVILPDRAAEDRWLAPGAAGAASGEELDGLLQPVPDDYLEAWPVSTEVNRPVNDGPELLEQVDERF